MVQMEALLGDSSDGESSAAAEETSPVATAISTKKRRRAGRDAPRPFKNAYLHFSMERRGEVAALSPEWTPQQISAEVGRQWKALSQQERKPWVELAQFDKARFQTELEQYLEKRRSEETPVPFKRKKSKNEPKQPDTAYICYWKSKRQELLSEDPDMDPVVVSKEVGRQWKALSEEERQIWKDMSAQDKLRYQREMATYREPTRRAVSAFVKKPIKDPYAPKAAKTGFQLFMTHNRESFTLLNMTLNEFRVEMSQLWKRLSEDDKSVWYSMAKQDQLRYEAEVNAYKPPAYLSTNAVRARKRLDELKKVAKSDADAPRLPMTAYHVYLKLKRREIQLQQPRLRHNEVMRQIGLAWKTLSAYDREPYLRKAEQDVDRFEKEMEGYLGEQVPRSSSTTTANASSSSVFADNYSGVDRASERPVTRKRRKPTDAPEVTITTAAVAKTRRKKNPEVPRRPQTAYNLMYMSRRPEILAAHQMSHNECSALCGRMWRQMSEQEREPYHRMAVEDKLRYESEMREYRSKLEQERLDEAEVTRKKSLGFRHFLNAKRSENEGLSYDEIAAIWNNMSEPHHTLWEELACEHVGGDDNDGDASDSGRLGDAGDYEDEEEQRRLEESARVVLGTRDLRQGDADLEYHHQQDGADHLHFEAMHHHHHHHLEQPQQLPHLSQQSARNRSPSPNLIRNHTHSSKRRDSESLGFRYFVDSKRAEVAEREHWDKATWVSEWEALSEPHRALWEELAEEHGIDIVGEHEDDEHDDNEHEDDEHPRAVSDLDSDTFAGFVTGGGDAPVNAFV